MALVPISPEKEYAKNPTIKKEDIAILKEWLDRQPHLPKFSELELILFYHSCENSMELTKITIDLNFTMRTHLAPFFGDMDPTSAKNVHSLETSLITPLKMVTKEGYKVIYSRLTDYDPANFFLENCAKIVVMISDLWQQEQGTFPGFVLVIDMDRVTLGHVGRLSIMSIKKILYYLQEAMPMRLKGSHFLNTPPFMDKILMLMKPFMKKQFTDLLHLHPPPLKSIFDHIPKEAFPKDMGGEFDSFDKIQSDTKAWLTKNRDFFLEREKMKVDESKRPGKPKDINEIFGIEGSFKKLDID